MLIIVKMNEKQKNAVAGDRTRVTRVTGGNTYHYTTTTYVCTLSYTFKYSFMCL